MKLAFHQMHAMKRAKAAHKFMIWRVAKAHDWEVTAQDIADETGLHISTVRRACKETGWDKLLQREYPGHPERYAVDSLLGMKYAERFA